VCKIARAQTAATPRNRGAAYRCSIKIEIA